jgi:hypothetical protein
MSGIARVKEKMKKKISFGEFAPVEEPKEKKGRKVYSLTQEDNMMLNKIFSTRLNLKHETSISTLMSEAIRILYTKEFD